MITQKTKQIAIVAGVTLLIMCVLVAIAVRIIMSESNVLSEQVAAIAVDQSQQVAATRLQKLVAETTPERELLRSYYLESQSDSIDFLNYIEQLARDRGVPIETINPNEVERNGNTFLSVGYAFTGSLSQVESFIVLLENIPYVSELQSVQLDQETGVLWQANVVIEVAVLTYESNN